eukprot:8041886-Ditylum_brightwellii.AAC.1
MEIGDRAKIKGSRQSKEKIPPPPTTFHSMHANIGYIDSRCCWVYGLKGILGEALKATFRKFKIEAGALPTNLCTDFDKNMIKGKCKE